MPFIRYTKKYKKELSMTFNSGNIYLDNFIKDSKSLDSNIGTTYIYLNSVKSEIIAYFNIGTGSLIDKSSVDSMKMGGSVHLNCFALDEKYQGLKVASEGILCKLSDYLLFKCIDVIKKIKKHVGFSFITLYSTKQGYNLYKRIGFEELETDMELPFDSSEVKCKPMYLPLMQ